MKLLLAELSPLLLAILMAATRGAAAEPALPGPQADVWRAERRLIDLHEHVAYEPERLGRAVRIHDAAGIGVAVNLDGGTVTPGANGAPSAFEKNKRQADTLFPGRFVHYMHLDYSGWDKPGFAEAAAKQIDEGRRTGAAGLKEFKRLGLFLRDSSGRLIAVDDPRLDGVWRRCGELGMPVSIHTGDPKAFWQPFDETNERWKELKDHKSWWFGDTNKYPAWKPLLESLDRVVGRHTNTTFVCVHFGNNAEEIDWVDRALDRHPNMRVDLAARIPEIGRHDPERVRRFFVKHQDRILFGTDFMVYNRLILGSSGNEPPPADADAGLFFTKHWRWFETLDRNWAHMTPIQGDWTISSVGLPASVLRKVYFDNARKLLARSLPLPRIQAARVPADFVPDGDLSKPAWASAQPVRIECSTLDATARPGLSTTVRALWSDGWLYLAYESPYTTLTTFDPPLTGRERWNMDGKGESLWERDVVEAFIAPDPKRPNHYGEFQVAPTNERLDLLLDLPKRDFAWSSRFESATRVDQARAVWTCELRIPIAALSPAPPASGTQWRANLLRCDRAAKAYLAWNPSLGGSFHAPDRFGVLEFR